MEYIILKWYTLSLNEHLKDDSLVITIDFLQPRILSCRSQEILMIQIGMNIA